MHHLTSPRDELRVFCDGVETCNFAVAMEETVAELVMHACEPGCGSVTNWRAARIHVFAESVEEGPAVAPQQPQQAEEEEEEEGNDDMHVSPDTSDTEDDHGVGFRVLGCWRSE